MWFIGDVHSQFDKYTWLVNDMPLPGGRRGLDASLQLGDMGVGFPARYLMESDPLPRDDEPLATAAKWTPRDAPILSTNHRFIRGNHDSPAMCREHPCYLGEAGYVEALEMAYIGGGLSVDRDVRQEGFDWWAEEELPQKTLASVVERFGDWKPRIVASHECPSAAKPYVVCNFAKLGTLSRTERALQAMFRAHQPDVWVFGHHHFRAEVTIGRTRFVGLNEMIHGPMAECIFEIPGMSWQRPGRGGGA